MDQLLTNTEVKESDILYKRWKIYGKHNYNDPNIEITDSLKELILKAANQSKFNKLHSIPKQKKLFKITLQYCGMVRISEHEVTIGKIYEERNGYILHDMYGLAGTGIVFDNNGNLIYECVS